MIQTKGLFLYQFTDISSYQDYMKRLSHIPHITDEIIKNMKQGVLKKITISQTIVQEIIDVLQTTVKEDTYENQFNHSKQIPTQIKKKFLQCISKNCINSIISKFFSK